MAPVQVLIVGETQQGKSTLISRIAEYSQAKHIDIGIGEGNSSCTTEVGVYQVSALLQSYYLRDAFGKRIEEKSISDLMDLAEDDAEVAVDPDNSAKTHTEYALIDTPGLDDSAGNDMDIMAAIMGRISDFKSLNAIVYVRSFKQPLNRTFQTFFKYLEDSMPSLCNGLIVVHTMFSAYMVEEAISRDENLEDGRRKAFRATTKLDLQHVFMENVPDEQSPFEVVRSLNQCTQLLRLLSNQRALSTSGFRLLKTPNMVGIDTGVVVDLMEFKSGIVEKWNKALNTSTAHTQDMMVLVQKQQRLKRQLRQMKEDLEEMDNDERVHLGQKAVSKDFGFVKNFLWEGQLWHKDKKVEFDSPSKIVCADTATTGAAKWIEVQQNDFSWKGKLTAPPLRSLNGTVTFYTTNKHRHTREIAMLKKSIANTEQDLEDDEEMLQNLRTRATSSSEAETAELASTIEACAIVITKVKQRTLDLTAWPKLKQFYMDPHVLDRSDNLKDFVSVYDAKLASAMRRT